MLYMNVLAIFLLLVLLLATGVLLFTRRFQKKFLLRDAADLGIDYGEDFLKLQARAEIWHEKNPEEMVYTTSHDGLRLVAHWWDNGANITVLYVHGYGNTGEQVTLVAERS